MTNPESAEPGIQTTEFWVTAASGAVAPTVTLLIAFGVPITPEQKAALLMAIPAELTLLATAYTLARSLRKRGTPG